MRLVAAAFGLSCLTGVAAAQPVVEGAGSALTGRVLGGGAGVEVVLVEAQRRGDDGFSAFQSFAEFGIAETDTRLVAVRPGVAASLAEPDDALTTTLDVLPSFDLPDLDEGRFGPALDPETLVIGEPDTLGPDVGLLALGDDEGGSLPPIALPEATEAEAPTPNPVPGAIWLLGTALIGLRLAHRRRA